MAVRRELEKIGLLKHPKVHVHHSCGAQAQRLRGIVKQLGRSLAGSPGEHDAEFGWLKGPILNILQ